MALPNDPTNSIFHVFKSSERHNIFELVDGKLCVTNVPLLIEIPRNVTLKVFLQYANPLMLPFHCLSVSNPYLSRKFSERDFLSIFRFKTWWSTQWVGNSGSDLQKETRWMLFDVPGTKSYVVIVPIIEGKFMSAFHLGTKGCVLICAESGSTLVKSSSFHAIAYVNVSENLYNSMKEAYSYIKVHLDTSKLLEEKSVASLINKFDGGISLRFLIIDDGWQSVNFEVQNPNEYVKSLIVATIQTIARLHRFDECEKFMKYKGGFLLGYNSPPFDPKKPEMLISKANELDLTEKYHNKAAQSGITDLSRYDIQIEKLKSELDGMFG
ncbi:stachyose synthase [Olea europaea subsp. europaea]|uniref:Stachyose synthase n=1 Tax=Olea europaea subsp. europaea TaxID=158383 RepID=A0A8S0QFR3_OLEEU|nr:stachyose synthase [Olea europaea subsp. europaea]